MGLVPISKTIDVEGPATNAFSMQMDIPNICANIAYTDDVTIICFPISLDLHSLVTMIKTPVTCTVLACSCC